MVVQVNSASHLQPERKEKSEDLEMASKCASKCTSTTILSRVETFSTGDAIAMKT
jgi:hypothetical protein